MNTQKAYYSYKLHKNLKFPQFSKHPNWKQNQNQSSIQQNVDTHKA